MITLLQIIQFLDTNGPSKIGSICDKFGSNRVSVGKILQTGIDLAYIQKDGKAPHSYYSITKLAKIHFVIAHDVVSQVQQSRNNSVRTNNEALSYSDRKALADFYKFESNGKLLQWADGFIERCNNPKRKLDIHDAAKRYDQIISSIEQRKNNCGLIDVTQEFIQGMKSKQKQTAVYIDTMYYCDRNNYDEFGRWPLAEKAFFAKTSSNIDLNKMVIGEILPVIDCLLHAHKIDAIGITPWSINRKVQVLWELKKALTKYGIPFIPLEKYFPNNIPVAQKSLRWDQRFINAQSSIQINLPALQKIDKKFKTILLIDDFVGSGATMNISAQKIKQMEITNNIIWLAFVWNFDMSYDVINEI